MTVAPAGCEQSPAVDAPAPAPTLGSRLRSGAVAVRDLLWKHWFLLGLGLAIGLGKAVPNVAKTGGYIRAEYSIKYGAVIVIFLLTGAGLKTRVLLQAAAAWRLHVLTQVVSLVVFPAVGYGVASGLRRTGMDPSLVSGLVICFSTSTTASTNVVFTKAGGGNEALAAVNAVIGNMLGIFLTPAWLVAYLGATGSVDYGSVIQLLAITVIAPMVVGNAVQMVWPLAVAAAQKRLDFGKTGSFCILLLVWSTFSNTFAKGIKVGGGSVAAMIFVDLAFFALFTAGSLALLSRGPARALLRADERDAVAVAMVAGTKTVALGIPIISAAFAGNPKIGLLSLPLICYHAEQILFGSLLTRPLSQWTKAAARRRDAAASAAAAAGEGRGGGGDGGGAAVAVDVTVAATPVCAAGAGGLEEGNGSVVDVASAAEEPVP